ncbi:MAG TPA: AMP-binding protein [Saprospiraceae bacterium]|nr:AMP-binding protein [Saprospiraceae bacterium]
MDFTRIFEVLEYQQQRFPQAISLAGRQGQRWRTWSTAELLAERDRVSAGLLRQGLRQGDRVGVLAHSGSPEWAIADAAMLQIGAVPVPMHVTARPDEIAHIARDAALKAYFVSQPDLLEKLHAAGAGPTRSFALSDHWPEGTASVASALPWSELAQDPSSNELEKIRYLRDGIRPQDLATILYTSGTTGVPKGVMLSHENIVSNVKSVLAIVPIGPASATLSYLPLSHIFERMVTYAYQAACASICSTTAPALRCPTISRSKRCR